MKKSLLPIIGIIMYIILSIIDKFIIKVSGIIYITVGISSITIILIGLIKDRKK